MIPSIRTKWFFSRGRWNILTSKVTFHENCIIMLVIHLILWIMHSHFHTFDLGWNINIFTHFSHFCFFKFFSWLLHTQKKNTENIHHKLTRYRKLSIERIYRWTRIKIDKHWQQSEKASSNTQSNRYTENVLLCVLLLSEYIRLIIINGGPYRIR